MKTGMNGETELERNRPESDEEKFAHILQQGNVREAVSVYRRAKESSFRVVKRTMYLRVLEEYIQKQIEKNVDEVYRIFCELYLEYQQEGGQNAFYHANIIGKALMEAGDERVNVCRYEHMPPVYEPNGKSTDFHKG